MGRKVRVNFSLDNSHSLDDFSVDLYSGLTMGDVNSLVYANIVEDDIPFDLEFEDSDLIVSTDPGNPHHPYCYVRMSSNGCHDLVVKLEVPRVDCEICAKFVELVEPEPTSTPQPTPNPTATPGPTPTPTPIPVELDEDTEINIFFDNSGSMGSTYNPLVQMQSTILQNCLLPFYNNDVNLYNQKVRVISVGGSSSYGNERSIKWISTQPTGNNNVINLAFADESNVYEAEGPSTGGWIDGSPTGNSDIATLRSVLNNAPTLEYLRGVIFVVNTGPGSYPNFGAFMDAVFDGVNYYAGTNGLSDRSEVSHVPDVTPGSTPQYYVNLIVNSLNSLGYNIPNC